ncbi:biopolymer transport protein ExbD [Rubinisphaera italica]|uniref:Biopolymer transport protein ExbD n=2 Tax=Rubinisphaera italica TaxID=2527969 RepID=A0A5C5XE06_9PLAN|nr:biopolymer transport protein ExbD [Rubinisphaera italica]
MPITFRCQQCQQLMRISRKKAGMLTTCPRCGSETPVPLLEDNAEVSLKPNQKEIVSEPERNLQNTQKDQSGIKTLATAENSSDAEEEEFQLRRAQTDFEEMDLTPMVDVTFLLLIFFMVTASFSIEKSIEVPPPNPDQEGASQTIQPLEELENQSILVEIDAENRFFIESEEVQDFRELPTLLADVRTRDSKNEVIITVDERSHHESIVQVIDAAQEIGLQRIRWGVMSNE